MGASPQASEEEREDEEADDEDPPPPEHVRELPTGQHQDGERQRVAVHDPLELGDADVQIALNRGSATFTIVLSSMIMNSPKETAASVHHLRFSGARSRALTQSS